MGKRILAGIMAFLMVSTLWVHTGYTTYAEEGEQTLTLSWRDQEAGTLTKEEIMAELLGKETAGERYDVISIEVKDNSDRKLDYQITDEAVRVLRKSSENRRIEYSFYDSDTGMKYCWILYKPCSSIEDAKAGVSVKRISDTEAKIRLDGTSFPAERTDLEITKEDGFGFTETEVQLYEVISGGEPALTRVSGSLSENGIRVQRVQALTAGQEYLAKPCKEGPVPGDESRPLERLEFAEPQVTMTVGERKSLDVLGYPSEAEPDAAELKWELPEGTEDVVSLVEEDGQHTGEVLAKKAGTAVVKVSWPKDAEEPALTAECTVQVEEPFNIPEEHVPDVYAVTQIATRLSEAESVDQIFEGGVTEDGTRWKWEWKDPDTKLAAFAGMEEPLFTAVYVENPGGPDEKRMEAALPVRMVSITGIRLTKSHGEGESPDTLTAGEKLYLDYEIETENTRNGGMEELKEYLYSAENPSGRLQIYFPSDTGKLLDRDAQKQLLYPYQFTAKASSPGKKTFTIAIRDRKTGKVLVKGSESVRVLKKSLSGLSTECIQRTEWKGKPCLKLTLDAAQYYPMTVQNADSTVIALGKITVDKTSTPDVVIVYIPYTEKKAGTAWLTITASDEQKTKVRYEVKVTDRQPKAVNTTVKLNQALEAPQADADIWFCQGYPLDEEREAELGQITVTIKGKKKKVDAAEYFTWEKAESNSSKNGSTGFRLGLTEEGRSLPKGSYKLQVQLPVKLGMEEENSGIPDVYPVELTVKVCSELPTVTAKQTKKVNTFYTNGEGDGVLTLTCSDGTVPEQVTLTDAGKTVCGYTLEKTEEETYRVSWKDRSLIGKKKGTLTYTLPGYRNPATGDSTFTKSYTVSTEYSKPALVLSAKSDTLYPRMDCGESRVRVTDKLTGEELELTEAVMKNTTGQNRFRMNLNPEEGDRSVLQFVLRDGSLRYEQTDTLQIKLKEANWNDSVTVNYRITVKSAAFSAVKLGKSTLTLHKGKAVYKAQKAVTTLGLAGCSNLLNMGDTAGSDHVYETKVYFTGRNDRSNAVLNGTDNSLILRYDSSSGQVKARLHDNKLEAGTYRFYVWVEHKIQGSTTKTYQKKLPLDIKVTDTPTENQVTLTTKGSIDVLRRSSTAITVKPKLTNLYGTITGAQLAGTDGWRFALDGNTETGEFYIRAAAESAYSTKHSYKVKLKLFVETEEGKSYTVTSKEFPIRVKQGVPKVTVSSRGNTLYRQVGNSLAITFSALLNKEDITIEKVELLSYRKDLFFSPWYTIGADEEDGQAPVFDVYFDPEQQAVLLENHTTEETLKNGTYTLKFAVYYRDRAGNEKVGTVKYGVKVS